MQGPENRPSFIDSAREFLGIQRGRSKWEYVGTGLKLAAIAEGTWALTDFITGHPLEGGIKALSALGVMLAGNILHDRNDQILKSRRPLFQRISTVHSTIANLLITGGVHYGIQKSFPLMAIALTAVPLGFVVLFTELQRQELNFKTQPRNP